jgi:capsular exopolysaccharide synthesis family protein
LEEPHSPESEAVRNLYASIRLSRPGKVPQVILVVSPSPKEGKTTLAVNLALATAQHHKTCLVDADLREPMIAQIFRLSSGSGLSEVLRETASLDQVLSNVPGVDNLTILASGSKPPNPGELVVSDSMCKIVATLAERYESVVIDSPPLIPYADARALSSMVDGVILVGLCGSTTREAVTLSAQILEDVHAPLLGIVLNGMSLDAPYYRYYRTD